jgi:hypothetical protein
VTTKAEASALPALVEAAQEAGYRTIAVVGVPSRDSYERARQAWGAAPLFGALLTPPPLVVKRAVLDCDPKLLPGWAGCIDIGELPSPSTSVLLANLDHWHDWRFRGFVRHAVAPPPPPPTTTTPTTLDALATLGHEWAATPDPTADVAGVHVIGVGLAKADVVAVVRAQSDAIRACYEDRLEGKHFAELERDGGLTMTLRFVVDGQGRVASAQAQARDGRGGGPGMNELRGCLVPLVEKLAFPAAGADRADVTVSWPLRFRAPGG